MAVAEPCQVRGESGVVGPGQDGPVQGSLTWPDGESRVRILVVDDRPENLLAVTSILEGDEFELLVANSGTEALAWLLNAEVALILLDVLMPDMDGFETARLIRAREACRHIPIIFLTAAGSDWQMVERGYAVGAADYLVKPLKTELVKAKVAVFVDLYRKSQQLRRHEQALRLAERARNEEALREREALYEASFNSAAVGITHIGIDGRWLRVNPRFCNIIGYSAEETTQLRIQDVVHPGDVAEHLTGLERLSHGEIESFQREARYLRKDGRVVWVDATVSALRDRAGAARHFVAVVEDVTERRDAEKRERLLADVSQLLLSSLDHRRDLDQVARTIAGSLGDWCMIGVNHQDDEDGPAAAPAVACAGRAREELAARVRGSLATSSAYARWLTEPHALTSTDPARDLASIWGLERKLAGELGVMAALSLPLSARRRAFGHVTFLSSGTFDAGDVTTAYDLTRRIALALDNGDLYRQTQHAVRARDEFLSIASHELRTPLTPLRIHLQRLLSSKSGEASEPGRVQTVLRRCERKVRRLEALVDTLFEASRLDRQVLRLNLAVVDLGELIRKVVDSFAEETASAGCQVALEVRGAVTGRWDRVRLEQVVSNVVENAIKYGPGKPVEIAVEGDEDHVWMTVRDHGVGIHPTQLDRIFERFHRVVSSPYHSGLRLGLSITRQIVEAHHGLVRADSTPGAGACFTIHLPRQVSGPLTDQGGVGTLDDPPPRANDNMSASEGTA